MSYQQREIVWGRYLVLACPATTTAEAAKEVMQQETGFMCASEHSK